jgi:ProP effector
VNSKPRTFTDVAGFLLPKALQPSSAPFMPISESVPLETSATALERQPDNQLGKQSGRAHAKRQDVFPVLDKLAALYPHLFGAKFMPMKRGIFQDLLTSHPEAFEKESLKAALAMHTRSTRYLSCVADGNARHDLMGEIVEPMAPEHVHHALLEVYKRRQTRSSDDLTPIVVERIVQAIEASGLGLEDYADLVRGRDETGNALLDQALSIARADAAKDEALLRAFKNSGQSVQAFADMYGMDAALVHRTLDRSNSVAASS